MIHGKNIKDRYQLINVIQYVKDMTLQKKLSLMLIFLLLTGTPTLGRAGMSTAKIVTLACLINAAYCLGESIALDPEQKDYRERKKGIEVTYKASVALAVCSYGLQCLWL